MAELVAFRKPLVKLDEGYHCLFSPMDQLELPATKVHENYRKVKFLLLTLFSHIPVASLSLIKGVSILPNENELFL